MQNFLNRRMFERPIRAAEGVYVPTLEDILQFYQGELDASGQPIDQEALAQAAELATILGTPANKDNSQFILDPIMAEKYKALGANIFLMELVDKYLEDVLMKEQGSYQHKIKLMLQGYLKIKIKSLLLMKILM